MVKWLAVAAVMAMTCAPAMAHPGDLKGMGSIQVLHEDPSDNCKTLGIDLDQLKTAVEAKLRSLSVPVADKSDDLMDIVVTAIPEDDQTCAVNIEIFLGAPVIPLNGDKRIAYAHLWTEGELLVGARSTINQRLIDVAGDLATDFANDYLKDNPKS